jgi:hypothetical protein
MPDSRHPDDEDDRPRGPRRRRPRPDEDDEYDEDHGDGGVSSLIPYKNGKALAAYYCGVFSLVPCLGNLLGPVAIVLGLMGLRYAREHPTAKGTGHAITGLVLGSITSLLYWGMALLFLIGFIAAAMQK